MIYDVGDYVYPMDLPRRVVCRVAAVDRVAIAGGDLIQILTLAPLAGPWRPGTQLIRLDGAVAPVTERRARPRASRMAMRRALSGAKPWAGAPEAATTGKVVRLRVRGLRVNEVPEANDA